MLSSARFVSLASTLLPLARFPFASQSAFEMSLLRLNRSTPIDCNQSRDEINSVPLFTTVHIEQLTEYTSCHTCSFCMCKTINQQVNRGKQVETKQFILIQNNIC